jgi:hypothetical protein
MASSGRVKRVAQGAGSHSYFPERHFSSGAAQTRTVSKARIRLDSGKSVRSFKGYFCHDISEFKSHMASHAVGLSQVRSPAIVMDIVALD